MLESHKDVITKAIKDLEVLIASTGNATPTPSGHRKFMKQLDALKQQMVDDTEEVEYLDAAW